MSPLPNYTADELVSHMPPAAIADLMEWGPARTPQQQFAIVLSRELPIDAIIHSGAVNIHALHDDNPVNEYFFLRAKLPHKWGTPLYRTIAKWQD
jgi:hypothetical protein